MFARFFGGAAETPQAPLGYNRGNAPADAAAAAGSGAGDSNNGSVVGSEQPLYPPQDMVELQPSLLELEGPSVASVDDGVGGSTGTSLEIAIGDNPSSSPERTSRSGTANSADNSGYGYTGRDTDRNTSRSSPRSTARTTTHRGSPSGKSNNKGAIGSIAEGDEGGGVMMGLPPLAKAKNGPQLAGLPMPEQRKVRGEQYIFHIYICTVCVCVSIFLCLSHTHAH